MSLRQASDRLVEALGLDIPPVALAFLDEPPPGAAVTDEPVPSACTFWRKAERDLFFSPAESHFECPIGAFVMGFDLSKETATGLTSLVGQIVEKGYIGSEEPANLPRWTEARRGILYGPLAGFPVTPDAVLLWLTPTQAMIWSEASGGASWGSAVQAPAFGRPACAAVPAGVMAGRPVLSLGCAGMRTFTDIADDRLLAVAPGARIGEIADAVKASNDLNAQMRLYYEGRRAAVAGSPEPRR